jgi:hypothetical protein
MEKRVREFFGFFWGAKKGNRRPQKTSAQHQSIDGGYLDKLGKQV